MKRRKKTTRAKSKKIPITNKLQKTFFTAVFGLILWAFFNVTESNAKIPLPDPGTVTELYANQNKQDLRQTFITAIEQAQNNVLLIIYALTDPQIIQALNNKCSEGCEIRLICDPNTSPQLERKLNRNITVTRKIGHGLMHQKILVIDDSYIWLGSANMTTESIKMHANLITGMHHPGLAAAIKAKAASMENDLHPIKVKHESYAVGGQEVEMWFLPDDAQAIERVKQLLKSAEKSIRVAMFTWTRYDLADAIIQAQKRGVDTRVVIDYHSGLGASSKIVQKLKDHGIPVSLSQSNGLLHHKFAYIDGKTLINGSANWTKAAFTQNDDCFIVLHDLTTKQKDQLDSLWTVIEQEAK